MNVEPPPIPPTDEEIREVMEAFGCSEDAARVLLGSARLAECQDGETIIDPARSECLPPT